jgi:hypothetical protein
MKRPCLSSYRIKNTEKIYASQLGLSDMMENYIENLSFSQPQNTAEAIFTTTLDFVKDYFEEGKQPVTGTLKIVECESDASGGDGFSEGAQGSGGSQNGSDSPNTYKIVYEGLAAFKDDTLVGYMDGVDNQSL